jgi:hypothetical protein
MDQFGKPIVIAELGVSGTAERQAEWLANAGRTLSQFPNLRALVYFNDTNPPVSGLNVLPDWRVGTAPLERRVEDVVEPVTANDQPSTRLGRSPEQVARDLP